MRTQNEQHNISATLQYFYQTHAAVKFSTRYNFGTCSKIVSANVDSTEVYQFICFICTNPLGQCYLNAILKATFLLKHLQQ